MKHINLMLSELKKPRQQETIFWQNVLVYQWKDIHITLLMKKHFLKKKRGYIGKCRVPLVQIYRKAMIFVHLHFYFHYQMAHSV